MGNIFRSKASLGFVFRRVIKHPLLWMLPDEVIARIEFEFRMIRRRSAYQFSTPKAWDANQLVNLGCGSAGRPGWINADAFPGVGINLVYDLRKKIPLTDGIARGIFCEHFLEHLDYAEEVPRFLAECHRILRPGGVIRIIVPDADLYLRAYAQGQWEPLAKIRPLVDGRVDYWYRISYRTRMELINMVFRQGTEHKFAYDWETLQMLLETHGFSEVTLRTFGHGQLPELCIDRPERASESLYVEAVVPQRLL